ncbi:DUF669 domain-containing protein [Azospirillaceae bacterium]
MANLGTTFDASTVDPAKPFEILPPGKYVVQIVMSEMRVTKDGNGQYLWLELDILEGEHSGKKLFDRLNLVNSNISTVEFAQRTLSAICRATGRMQVQDSDELHLVPMLADVKVQPPKNGYGETNSLRYLPLERGTPVSAPTVRPAAPVQTAAAKPPAQPARPAAAPWRRTS